MSFNRFNFIRKARNFDPSMIPTLEWGLIASDDKITSSGTGVSSWSTTYGLPLTFTQPTDNRPVYGTFNGIKSVNFSSSTLPLTVEATSGLGANSGGQWCVGLIRSGSPAGSTRALLEKSTASTIYYTFAHTVTGAMGYRSIGAGVVTLPNVFVALNDSNWSVFVVSKNQDTNQLAGYTNLGISNQVTNSNSPVIPDGTLTRITLGAIRNNGTAYIGKIAALFVGSNNSATNASNNYFTEMLVGWLLWRYNLFSVYPSSFRWFRYFPYL